MTPIIIPCPQCGRELKIHDRHLLGRKGKCPKCGHAFVMEEPSSVELKLVENTSFPVEGTGALYVSSPVTLRPPVTAPSPFVPAPGLLAIDITPSTLPVRKKSQRGQWVKLAVIALTICVLAGIGVYAWNIPAGKAIKPENGNESPRGGEVQALRKSLEAFRDNCNSRIELIETKFGKKSPVHLTPGKLDLRKTDSALKPYNGVLTLLIAYEGASGKTRKFEFQFTLEPTGDDSWEFVSCYGGPVTGASSVWALTSLANNTVGVIGMSWLLGYDEAVALLQPHVLYPSQE